MTTSTFIGFVVYFVLIFSASLKIPVRSAELLNPAHCGLLPFEPTSDRFIVLGAKDPPDKGLGNLLIFYPSAYYYGLLTSRFMVIDDNSYLGQLCLVIKCGFPLLSEIGTIYPDIFSREHLSEIKTYFVMDFLRMFETNQHVNNTLITVSGYDGKSDWWLFFNHTAHCISKLSGCYIGDVGCSDRFAFQQLITGPITLPHDLRIRAEKRMKGIPQNWKQAYFTLPHRYLPRYDFAIHLRNQFDHFEQEFDVQHPDYKTEVKDWLDNFDSRVVFQYLYHRLKEELDILRPQVKLNSPWYNKNVKKSPRSSKRRSSHPVYIYLSADNQDVKEAFRNYIMDDTALINGYQVRLVTLESSAVYHVKNIEQMKAKTNGSGIFDMAFDWYALSLSNVILTWRKGGTRSFSTFVTSAQRMSGTKDYSRNFTHNGTDSGRGVGPTAYQLAQLKNGEMRFEAHHAYAYYPGLDQKEEVWIEMARKAQKELKYHSTNRNNDSLQLLSGEDISPETTSL